MIGYVAHHTQTNTHSLTHKEQKQQFSNDDNTKRRKNRMMEAKKR